MPKYIHIDTASLDVSVVDRARGHSGLVIPVGRPPNYADYHCSPEEVGRSLPRLAKLVRYEIRYRRFDAAQRRARRSKKARLRPEDAWLLAIAAIMWEAIIQGMTWDTAKYLVDQALSKMRLGGVAPKRDRRRRKGSSRRQTKSNTSLGVEYRDYDVDGRLKYQMFIGLKRWYRQSREMEEES